MTSGLLTVMLGVIAAVTLGHCNEVSFGWRVTSVLRTERHIDSLVSVGSF